ncbi:MAG: hypothetical protein ACMG6E_08370 [Candidatus Roizmanbacteria bacterium]
MCSLNGSEQPSTMFQPTLQSKSRQMVRDKPVQDILYEDAFKRKAKQILK